MEGTGGENDVGQGAAEGGKGLEPNGVIEIGGAEPSGGEREIHWPLGCPGSLG